jgi:hypothetical protein
MRRAHRRIPEAAPSRPPVEFVRLDATGADRSWVLNECIRVILANPEVPTQVYFRWAKP